MVATPRLLTSECAAHYPRLWGLAESLSQGRTVRRYPLVLRLIALTQTFEQWLEYVVNVMSRRLDIDPPNLIRPRTYWGTSAVVGEQLDFFADTIAHYASDDAESATEFIHQLMAWNRLILALTSQKPRYVSSVRCKACSQYSVLKCENLYVCVNDLCGNVWAKH